ncbi:MAG: hypothetical protein KDK36_05500 [Leptospiraceae bacterium]|nr:hypothetical protein [Leptospiraceae bacterium]
MNSEILNPGWEGKLIFAFKKIRDVALIELRNGFSSIPEPSVLFYIKRMEDSILTNEIDLKKFEQIKLESKEYVIYEIFYSKESQESIQIELEDKFNYFLISYSDNIVNDYHHIKREFEIKCNSGNFCKIKDIDSLLSIYKKHLKILESGRLII